MFRLVYVVRDFVIITRCIVSASLALFLLFIGCFVFILFNSEFYGLYVFFLLCFRLFKIIVDKLFNGRFELGCINLIVVFDGLANIGSGLFFQFYIEIIHFDDVMSALYVGCNEMEK